MREQKRNQDELLHALAEFTAFFANETNRQRKHQCGKKSKSLMKGTKSQGYHQENQRTSPRHLILKWLKQYSSVQRAALCSVVDVEFVQLVISMIASSKSDRKKALVMQRVDQFQVIREARSSSGRENKRSSLTS